MDEPYQLHDCGLGDWLLSFQSPDCASELTRLFQHLKTDPTVLEPVVGYDSLLIRTDGTPTSHSLTSKIDGILKTSHREQISTQHHDIQVVYNGPDLEEVAELTKLTTEKIIEAHTAPLYTVRFLGFSPGFAYLDGLDPILHLPRRSTPRPKMAAGAVAIGAAHAGIYSIPSPGGWNWLGNTDHPLFNKNGLDATAFTLHPGDTLRFHPLAS